MSSKEDILEWMRTTKVDFPGFQGVSQEGKSLSISKYLNGTFVVKRGVEEIYRGDDLEEALREYESARGFPSGEPNRLS